MKKIIEVGDIVQVDCNNSQITISHEAEVINIPRATGESWIFLDKQSDKVIYCSEGITVTYDTHHNKSK